MGSSPDIGGRYGLGRPLEPTVHEQQTTAQVFVAKQSLGIMLNTLEVPFTQLGDQAWKYQSPATKPLVPAKVMVAVVHPELKKNSELEDQTYKELTEELPLDLSFNLKEENKKPPYQRDYRFLVLDQLMRFLSKMLTHLDFCQKLHPEDYQANSNKVRSWPFSALWMWLELCENTLQSMEKLRLSSSNELQLSSTLAHHQDLLKELQKTVNAILKNDQKQAIENLTHLNEKLDLLTECYRMGKDEHPLKLTEHLVYTLRAITHAMKKGTQAHLFLGINCIADCYQVNKQTTGGIGKGVRLILQKIIHSIKEIDGTETLHAQHLAHLLLFFFPSLVFQASGAPRLMAKEGKKALVGEKERLQSFAYKLASCLIGTSLVLPSIAQEAFNLTHIAPEQARKLIDLIDLFAMNIPILASLEGCSVMKNAEPVLCGMRLLLLERLHRIAKDFQEAPNNEFNTIGIALRQAILALQKEDRLAYFEALIAGAQEAELTRVGLKEECEAIIDFTMMLLSGLNSIHEQDILSSVLSQRA